MTALQRLTCENFSRKPSVPCISVRFMEVSTLWYFLLTLYQRIFLNAPYCSRVSKNAPFSVIGLKSDQYVHIKIIVAVKRLSGKLVFATFFTPPLAKLNLCKSWFWPRAFQKVWTLESVYLQNFLPLNETCLRDTRVNFIKDSKNCWYALYVA